MTIRDDNTTGFISAENEYLSLGGNPGVNKGNLNIHTESGQVGIGTTTTSTMLHVSGNDTSNTVATFESNDSLSYIQFKTPTTSDNYVRIGTSANDLKFLTNNSQKMLIQSDGKVGIGTDSPVASALEVQGEFGISDGSGAVHTQLYRETSTGGITFKRVNNSDGSDNGGEFLKAKYGELIVTGNISSSGNLYIGNDNVEATHSINFGVDVNDVARIF